MTVRQRSAALALLAVLGCLTAVLASHLAGLLWAGPHPVPARTAQEAKPEAPEPPVMDPVPVPSPPPAGDPAPSPGTRCPADPPTPVVSLSIRVPAGVGPSQEIEYRISVRNTSQAPAHHVLVRNPLPVNAKFVRADPAPGATDPELVWQLGTLAGCAHREIVLVLAPTGSGDVINCARVQFEHGQCVSTRISRPALGVRKFGPQQAALNQPLTYRVVVTNTGSIDAVNVLLTDTLPEGLEHATRQRQLTWEMGRLAPGQSREVQYQLIARKVGQLCNVVSVTADGGIRAETQSCATIGQADLSLIKVGPDQRYVTRQAEYQIIVSNPGSLPLNNVVVTDVLPPQTTLLSKSEGGQVIGNEVRWLIGALPPGGRRTVQVALQAQAPGAVVNRATAAAEGGITAQAEAHTLFEGAGGLTFAIDARDFTLEVGAETTFTITILNQGNAPANKLQMTATVAEEMTFLGAKGPTNFRQEGRQIIFEPLPALQPRASASYEIGVRAQRPGDALFQASLTGEQPLEPNKPVVRQQRITIYGNGAGRAAPPPGVQERITPQPRN